MSSAFMNRIQVRFYETGCIIMICKFFLMELNCRREWSRWGGQICLVQHLRRGQKVTSCKPSLEKGSDQLIGILYTQFIYPYVRSLRIQTLFEAQPVWYNTNIERIPQNKINAILVFLSMKPLEYWSVSIFLI